MQGGEPTIKYGLSSFTNFQALLRSSAAVATVRANASGLQRVAELEASEAWAAERIEELELEVSTSEDVLADLETRLQESLTVQEDSVTAQGQLETEFY